MEEFQNEELRKHREKLLQCSLCPQMKGGPVCGAVRSEIISIGQAPGIHEEKFGKPFAYTAGKTLFKWFESIEISEEEYRSKICMSAVCRCFPGKSSKSGDRKPNQLEIANCESHLKNEFRILKPKLVIPIGKMAIDLVVGSPKYLLRDIIGQTFRFLLWNIEFDCIPLPHPSGLNAWNHTKEGKSLILQALEKIRQNSVIKKTFF